MAKRSRPTNLPLRRLNWWAIGVGFLAVLALALANTIFKPASDLITIKSSAIQMYEARAFNQPRTLAAAENIQTITQRQRLSEGRITQYHVDVEIPQKQGQQGVLIEGLGAEALVFINGTGIGAARPNKVANPILGTHFLSAQIPTNLVNSGSNRIDIIVAPSPWHQGIGEVKIGPAADINNAAQQIEAMQQALQIGVGIAGLICLVCLPLLFFLKRDFATSIALLGLTTYLLGGAFLGETLNTMPALIGFLSFGGFVFILLGALIFAHDDKLQLKAGGFIKGMALALCVGGFMIVLAWRFDAPHDVLAGLSYTPPILMAGIGAPLLLGLEIKQLLEDRVLSRQKTEELSKTMVAQAAQIERQAQWQAVLEERKRFTRDIHDGIGGQLVSLLWRVRAENVPAEELANELEAGIADLRLVADALDEEPVSLSIALWNFEARARKQLQFAGIDLCWDLPAHVDARWSDARAILSLYRMLQECVANIVRHANAKNVQIVFDQIKIDNEDWIKIRVEDDGIGIQASANTATGRGLTNLQTRTKLLGGNISIGPSEHEKGVRIEILLPVLLVGENA